MPPARRPGSRFEHSLPFSYLCGLSLCLQSRSLGAWPCPVSSLRLFPPCVRVALVGLLRRERPARRGARPVGALATLGAAVGLRPGFSRLPPCFAAPHPCGFPMPAGQHGLPAWMVLRMPAACVTFLNRGRNDPPPNPSVGRTPAAFFFFGGAHCRPPSPPASVFHSFVALRAGRFAVVAGVLEGGRGHNPFVDKKRLNVD